MTTAKKGESLRVALTKRALERQFMRAGVTRRAAEVEVARLSQDVRWRRLNLPARAEIAWKTLLATTRKAR